MTEAEYKRVHQDDLSELERLARELADTKRQLQEAHGAWYMQQRELEAARKESCASCIKAQQRALAERDAALAEARDLIAQRDTALGLCEQREQELAKAVALLRRWESAQWVEELVHPAGETLDFLEDNQ